MWAIKFRQPFQGQGRIKENQRLVIIQPYNRVARAIFAQNRNEAATLVQNRQMQITQLKIFLALLTGEHVSLQKFTNCNVFLKETPGYCLFFNEQQPKISQRPSLTAWQVQPARELDQQHGCSPKHPIPNSEMHCHFTGIHIKRGVREEVKLISHRDFQYCIECQLTSFKLKKGQVSSIQNLQENNLHSCNQLPLTYF